MDPLERVSPDIHYLILQHLDVKDISEASTASSSWNQTIAESATCMRKIKISMKLWNSASGTKQQQTDDKIKVLQSSVRPYRNICIVCRFDKFLSQEFWNFLKLSSETVTELNIKSIKLDTPSKIELPKLEILKLTYVPKDIRNVLLASSRSIKKLKIKLESPLIWNEGPRSDEESLDSVKSLLERNQTLEDLDLCGPEQYSSFFTEDFSGIVRFQLKSLKVKTAMRLSRISERNEQNFINFLATQSNCLESFFIDVCRRNVIQFVFNRMPALTSVHFDVMIMNDYQVKELNLKLNERIVDLRIPYINHQQDIKEFLSVAPNLVSLFVAHLSHETMELIARNLKNLKTLKYRYDEIDCEDFYDQLKDDFPEVNQDIEMIVDYEYT